MPLAKQESCSGRASPHQGYVPERCVQYQLKAMAPSSLFSMIGVPGYAAVKGAVESSDDEKARRGQEWRRQMDAAEATREESQRLTVLLHDYGTLVR